MDPLLREFDHVPPGWWYRTAPSAAPSAAPCWPCACACACSACGVPLRSSSDLLFALFVMASLTFLVCRFCGDAGSDPHPDPDPDPDPGRPLDTK